MIKPFTRHFFDLPLPILVLVRRDRRKVTCRTFRELPADVEHANPITRQDAERLLTEHADVGLGAMFRRRPIPGRFLSSTLDARIFEELGGVCLDLDGMLGKGEWSDRSNWVFPLDHAGTPQVPFNRFVMTRDTKARTPRLLATAGKNCALQIYVPFASCDFDSSSFSVALHRDFGLVGNLDPGAEVTYADVLGGAQKPFADIALSTDAIDLAPNAYGTVTAQLVDGSGKAIRDAEAELFIEATGGYLPQQRAMTSKGKTQFRIGALGLAAGESFRVKIGFRHFSSVAEVKVQVV
jgi:intein/homing endonuclease